jgi:hypothetical protein
MVVYSTAAMARRRRVSARLASHLLWGLLVILPACTGSREWIYEKPQLTPAQLDHDRTACRKVAASRSLFKAFDEERVDRDLFNQCMQARGYTVKAVPLP